MMNQELHKEVLESIEALGKAKAKSWNYNERRKEATERLGRAVSEVWEALERGEDVCGAASKKDYCLATGLKIRWMQRVVDRHRNPQKEKPPRTVTLKPGMLLKCNGSVLRVVDLRGHRLGEDDGYLRVGVELFHAEDQAETETETEEAELEAV